jgi:hypothetical protein
MGESKQVTPSGKLVLLETTSLHVQSAVYRALRQGGKRQILGW